MKVGALEILLVGAEGLKHARFLGSSSQYVITQCGDHTHTSKSTSGEDKRAWWNEKVTFKLTWSEWKSLTTIKLRIMEKDQLLEDCCVGEATIDLRGILREGEEKGNVELRPAPYNIVLKDGTYEGELKVGLNFNSNIEADAELTMQEGCNLVEKQSQSLYTTILNFTLQRVRWPRFLFFKTFTKY